MSKTKDRSRELPAVLALICEGMSLRGACAIANMPHASFLRRVREDAALAEEYEFACRLRADVHFDDIHELEQQVLEGELAPDRFRAVMDARKWRLARMQPKVYGEKSASGPASPDDPVGQQPTSVIASAVESLRDRQARSG